MASQHQLTPKEDPHSTPLHMHPDQNVRALEWARWAQQAIVDRYRPDDERRSAHARELLADIEAKLKAVLERLPAKGGP